MHAKSWWMNMRRPSHSLTINSIEQRLAINNKTNSFGQRKEATKKQTPNRHKSRFIFTINCFLSTINSTVKIKQSMANWIAFNRHSPSLFGYHINQDQVDQKIKNRKITRHQNEPFFLMSKNDERKKKKPVKICTTFDLVKRKKNLKYLNCSFWKANFQVKNHHFNRIEKETKNIFFFENN